MKIFWPGVVVAVHEIDGLLKLHGKADYGWRKQTMGGDSRRWWGKTDYAPVLFNKTIFSAVSKNKVFFFILVSRSAVRGWGRDRETLLPSQAEAAHRTRLLHAAGPD